MVHIPELNQVEYNSVSHRTTGANIDIVRANSFSNEDQRPQQFMDKPRTGAVWSEASFGLKIAGSGTAGTPPVSLDDPFLACGFKYLNAPGSSDTYTWDGLMLATAFDLDMFMGNAVKMQCKNAIGTGRIELRKNEPGKIMFDMFGQFVAPTEAVGSAALSGDDPPVILAGQTITVGSDTLHLLEADIDFGNETDSPNEDMSADALAIEGVRQANIVKSMPTLSVLAVFPAFSVSNYWVELLADTASVFDATIGSVAGNILDITMTGYQNAPIVPVEQDGKIMARLNFRMGTASGEPLKFIFT